MPSHNNITTHVLVWAACSDTPNFLFETLQQLSPKICWGIFQVGITCKAIEETSRSSKAVDERVIIKLHDGNAAIARFCHKNDAFDFYDKIPWYAMIYHDLSCYVMICHAMP